MPIISSTAFKTTVIPPETGVAGDFILSINLDSTVSNFQGSLQNNPQGSTKPLIVNFTSNVSNFSGSLQTEPPGSTIPLVINLAN